MWRSALFEASSLILNRVQEVKKNNKNSRDHLGGKVSAAQFNDLDSLKIEAIRETVSVLSSISYYTNLIMTS